MEFINIENFKEWLIMNLKEEYLNFFDINIYLEDLEKQLYESDNNNYELPKYKNKNNIANFYTYEVETIEKNETYKYIITF